MTERVVDSSLSNRGTWGTWNADEEALFCEFAASHVAGTPWSIREMNDAVQTRGLDCRVFIRHVLLKKAQEIRSARKKDIAEKEKEFDAARDSVRK